ncbi:O-antigen ligase family protein [Sphingomonas sp.]|uniref:O-antigen ligase family protein n=1 Tax=Sphingomonas sp. TaxID=28214 RepID=UPI0026004CC2|nr:O-antigen ligase family protein [Sphingomonas sp.]MBV9527162.1 O-antigen ligase family protein [Sphingomonas sp.]
MASRGSQTAAPIYLFLCLILGGSAQGMFANMVLQLLGLGLVAWAVIAPKTSAPSRAERQLLALILLALALVALQLVPLPPSIWPHLGGRERFAVGYLLLGVPVPWLPISLAPYDSLATLLAVIPPLALLFTVLRIGARPLWLIAALLAGLVSGILVGVLQVSSIGPAGSPWYFYPETNVGVATGFFANADHMATLLVISIPFLGALLGSVRTARAGLPHYSGVIAVVAAVAAVVALGIVLNGSLAGYGLALPVALMSILLALRPRSRARIWVAIGTVALIACGIAALVLMPIGDNLMRDHESRSVAPRREILATSAAAGRAFMPLGSGLGTFPRVYALYEDHDRLDPTTSVNHAHDDYIELALETGVPGVLLMALFLLWWAGTAMRTWMVTDSGPFARAAVIASAAILVHSLVDFPLRTAAIGSAFAMCIALLVRWRPSATRAPAEQSELRPARHVVIG